MATVRITPTAVDALDRLIRTRSLPYNTRERVVGSLSALSSFPLIGQALHGRWDGFRFVLGPWRWMIVLYVYDEPTDTVYVVTIQDSRAADAATSG
ncbi:MAG TPA: type II toxin-antitoxin system RelE/ParE family toxin [Candidatus Limnocylindrales bacterium]|nr:type II toxin-antitoxin system RelE/ParE family toxin [Candidatus Limnocylindrales bacterium]